MADVTPVKRKAVPGWYPHPKKDGFERLWDGEVWTEKVRPIRQSIGATGGGLIGLGIFIAVLAGAFGGAMIAGDGDTHTFGVVVVAVGGAMAQIVLLIGIVAKGVEIGTRNSRESQ